MVERVEVLTPAECDQVREQIHALEPEWIRRHAGSPFFTLGAASYLDKDEVYYDRAQQNNPLLTQHFGWLHERVMEKLQGHLKAPVSFYERFALPGFHVFGGSKALLQMGNASVHCDVQYNRLDWSGLSDPDFENPLSFTLTIKLPQSGGGLRVWDIQYAEIAGRSAEELRPIFRERTRTLEPYTIGEMVLHSGHQVHQIAPVENITKEDERLTMQGHGIKCGDTWIIYW
jgi:hypothetical protein